MSAAIYALAIVGFLTVIVSLAVAFFLVGGWVIRVHRRRRRGTAVVHINPNVTALQEGFKRAGESMRKAQGGIR